MIHATTTDQQHLRRLGVAALYLFGSRAQGVAGPHSDYDFAVLLNDPRNANDTSYPSRYDALYDACVALLRDEPLPPEDVVRHCDIVFLQRETIPLELRFHVVRYGRVVYDGDPRRRARFEEYTTTRYCDFRPLLDTFDRAILAAV